MSLDLTDKIGKNDTCPDCGKWRGPDHKCWTAEQLADAEMKRDVELQKTSDTEMFLHEALGGNINVRTLTPLVIVEIMDAHATRILNTIDRQAEYLKHKDKAIESLKSKKKRQADEITRLAEEVKDKAGTIHHLTMTEERCDKICSLTHEMQATIDCQTEEIARIRAEHAEEIGVLNDKCVVMCRSRDKEIARLRDESEKFPLVWT